MEAFVPEFMTIPGSHKRNEAASYPEILQLPN